MGSDDRQARPFDWDAAIRTYNHRVVVSVMAMGVPVDEAEDLAQQAWMRLMEQHQSGRLAEEIRLPGLAVAQARFLALNALKRNQRELQRYSFSKGDWGTLANGDASPEAKLLTREELHRALETLENCSESARAVFLHIYDDPPPSHKVVARRVGLSVQRVRQILCEVRQKLRRALETERRS